MGLQRVRHDWATNTHTHTHTHTVRRQEISSLKFGSTQYYIILYRLYAVQQTSRRYLPSITETLYLLNNSIILSPQTLAATIVFCFYAFDCLSYISGNHAACSFMTGLFHLTPSTSIHVATDGRISFLFKAVCVYTTFYLYIHKPFSLSILPTDTWVVSIFWLLRI